MRMRIVVFMAVLAMFLSVGRGLAADAIGNVGMLFNGEATETGFSTEEWDGIQSNTSQDDIDSIGYAFDNCIYKGNVIIAYNAIGSYYLHDYSFIALNQSDALRLIGVDEEDISGAKITTSGSSLIFSAYSANGKLFDMVISQNDDGTISVVAEKDGETYTPEITMMTFAEFLEAYSGQTTAEAVATEVSRIASRQTVHLVSTRVLNVFSPRPHAKGGTQQAELDGNPFKVGYFEQNTGLSAGDEGSTWGVWGMGAYSKFRNTETIYNMDGQVGVFMAGLDRLFFHDKLVVGLAAGYESSSIDFDDIDEDLTGQGFSLTPYVALRLGDSLLLKGTFSATALTYDPDNGDDYDSTRLMTDISAQYTWLKNAWMLSGEVGFMYVDEDADEEDSSDVYLGELRAAATIGYAITDIFVPYVKATYHNDLSSSGDDSLDDDDLEAALGLNFYRDAWIVSLEFNTMLLRENQELYGGSLLVRYEF